MKPSVEKGYAVDSVAETASSDWTQASDVETNSESDISADHKVQYTDKGKKRADSEARRSWNYTCDFAGCGQRFNRPCRLESHMRTHTKERPFACDQQGCSKTFPRKDHLQRHMAHHHAEPQRNHACTWDGCGKTFTSNGRLQRHKEVHESKFYCVDFPPCKEAFRKQETLDAHTKTVHMETKAYSCTFIDSSGTQCSRGYQTENSLRRHIATAHGEREEHRYFCMLCPAPGTERETVQTPDGNVMPGQFLSFATALDLKTHDKDAHPPICPICGQKFKNRSTLDSHFKVLHTSPTKQELFHCPYQECGKIFNRRSNMNTHVAQVHESQYRFVCAADAMQLSKHPDLNGWNGVNACGKQLKSKAALEQHVRTHHLGLPNRKETRRATKTRKRLIPDPSPFSMLTGVGYEQGRPIACLDDECPYRFARNRDLKRHMVAVHGHVETDVESGILEREATNGGQFWIGGLDELDPASIVGSTNASLPQTPMPYLGEQAAEMDTQGGFEKATDSLFYPMQSDLNMFHVGNMMDFNVETADVADKVCPPEGFATDFLASLQRLYDQVMD